MLAAINLRVPLRQRRAVRRRHSPWRPGKAPPVNAGILSTMTASFLLDSLAELASCPIKHSHSPLVIKHDTCNFHRYCPIRGGTVHQKKKKIRPVRYAYHGSGRVCTQTRGRATSRLCFRHCCSRASFRASMPETQPTRHSTSSRVRAGERKQPATFWMSSRRVSEVSGLDFLQSAWKAHTCQCTTEAILPLLK